MAHDLKDSPSEGDLLSAEEIVGALDKKRRELDWQIEQFKAIKEQEFRAHEYWLRHSARKGDLKPKTAAQHVGNGSQRSIPPGDLEVLEPSWPKERGPQGNEKKIDPVLTTAFYGEEGLQELSRQKGSPNEDQKPHERDAEFAGLFTPMFLPLLDGSTNDRNRNSQDQPPSALITDENLTSHDTKTSTTLTDTTIRSSSAAELPTTEPYSQARRLSTSAPDEHEHTHRRGSSSGKSDTSIASRRSSFKNPNTPRSPKRVMFDIDHTIVSPSTSPSVERKAPLMKKSKKTGETGEEYEIVKKKDRKHKKGHKKRDKSGDSMAGAIPSRTNGTSNAGSSAIEDDFEKVSFGNDDMFSFDEDLDVGSEPGERGRWSADTALDGGDEEVGEASESSTAMLTGSSPHAGSLPIEIKWPGRRNEGGS